MVRRLHLFLPWLIGLAGLALYLTTLNRGLQPADSGEFQWIGATLGLAHPPGFPLYTILATLFSLLPGGSPAAHIALFSAVTSALTLAIVYRITVELLDHDQPSLPAAVLGGLTAALTLATSTTFWVQGTTANIRSLTTLFTALAFWALIRLTRKANLQAGWRHPLTGFALALGFGLTHHLSLAFIGLVMGLFALWQGAAVLRQRRQWLILTAVGLLALLPLLYLPLVEPTLRSWSSFWTYALGLGFSGDFFYFRTATALADRLLVMGNVLLFQFSPLLLLGAAAGWLIMTQRRPRPAILLGGTFAVHTLVTATYRAPQTVEYMLPAYLPLVVALGYATAVLMDGMRTGAGRRWRLAARWAIPLLFGAIALGQGLNHYPSLVWLAHANDTEHYVNSILEQAPPDAVVQADWHWYTPLRYAQAVAGQRPDLEVIFVFPRSADYGADWAADIAAQLERGRPVVTTHFDETAYRLLPAPLPLGESYLFGGPAPPPNAWEPLPQGENTPSPVEWSGWRLVGQTTQGQGIDEPLKVEVRWRPTTTHDPATARLFAQLRDDSGRPLAQVDLPAVANSGDQSVTQLALTPFAGTPPGRYAVVIGRYQTDGDQPPDEVELTHITLSGSDWRPITRHPVRWPQPAAARTLIGYDWDNTLPDQNRLYLHWQLSEDGRYWSEAVDLPPFTPFELLEIARGFGSPQTITIEPEAAARYVPFGQGIVWLGNEQTLAEQALRPGERILTRQRFASSRPVVRDIGFAVRLIGLEEDHYTWAWLNPDEDIDIPALGAIPTLKWIAGSEIWHPRRLTIPPTAAPGQAVEGFLRPYDVFTNQPLPILDRRLVESGKLWVPFDTGTIAAQP